MVDMHGAALTARQAGLTTPPTTRPDQRPCSLKLLVVRQSATALTARCSNPPYRHTPADQDLPQPLPRAVHRTRHVGQPLPFLVQLHRSILIDGSTWCVRRTHLDTRRPQRARQVAGVTAERPRDPRE